MVKFYILLALSLGASITLNTIFLTETMSWVTGISWAIAELAAFFFVRNWFTIPIKVFVQVISFTLSFMFLVSFLQDQSNVASHAKATTNDQSQRIDSIDKRLDEITLNGYLSTDPTYIIKRQTLEDTLFKTRNTTYKYYGEAQSDTFGTASNDCNPIDKKSAKVTRDYPSTCKKLTQAIHELAQLEERYNGAAAEATEVRELQAERSALIEDTPKLGQFNIAGLTSTLATSFNIEGLTANLLLLLTGAVCLVLTSVNLAFSLKLVLPEGFDPDSMGTGMGMAGYNTQDILSSIVIPADLTVATTPNSKFAKVLAVTLENHCEGCAINRSTVQSYMSCSNNIAQAVVNTLAHNNLLRKERQSWYWA